MRKPWLCLVLVGVLFPFSAAVRAQQQVSCSSDDGKKHYCDADTRQGVSLIKQRSGSACTQGYSWDYDSRGVWVDHGCRGDFSLQAGPAPGDWGGKTVSCASEDGKRHYCSAETRAGVRLLKQRSDSPCTRGDSWGFDDRGVWVDRGCRGDFALETDRHPARAWARISATARIGPALQMTGGGTTAKWTPVEERNWRSNEAIPPARAELRGTMTIAASGWITAAGQTLRRRWVDTLTEMTDTATIR